MAASGRAPGLIFASGARSGEVVEVSGESIEIGRDPACDLALDDEKASRRHVRLTWTPGRSPAVARP